jgi:hypothetical protein
MNHDRVMEPVMERVSATTCDSIDERSSSTGAVIGDCTFDLWTGGAGMRRGRTRRQSRASRTCRRRRCGTKHTRREECRYMRPACSWRRGKEGRRVNRIHRLRGVQLAACIARVGDVNGGSGEAWTIAWSDDAAEPTNLFAAERGVDGDELSGGDEPRRSTASTNVDPSVPTRAS